MYTLKDEEGKCQEVGRYWACTAHCNIVILEYRYHAKVQHLCLLETVWSCSVRRVKPLHLIAVINSNACVGQVDLRTDSLCVRQ